MHDQLLPVRQGTRSARRSTHRPGSGRIYRFFEFCLGLSLCLAPIAAHARAVLDPADPAFDNATVVPMPPAGIPDGATTFDFTVGNTSINLTSTSSVALKVPDFFSQQGIYVSSFADPSEGVVVTFSPAIEAVAFVASEGDGCPAGDFVGASTSERVAPGRPCDDVFFGAADIGPIGTVNLRNPASLFIVHEIRLIAGASTGATADLAVATSADDPAVLNDLPSGFSIDLENLGPDASADVRVTTFLPKGIFTDAQPNAVFDPDAQSARWQVGDVPAGVATRYHADIVTPSRREFSCESILTNVAVAGGMATDPVLGNNVAIATLPFDAAAVRQGQEICGNGIDDECDGRTDCADSDCDCRPVLPPVPGGGDPLCFDAVILGAPGEPPRVVSTCIPAENDANNHQCEVPRGRCGGVVLPAYCCDPSTWSNPSNNGSTALAACDVGVPGCTPRDPNFKESDPTVNVAGYGFTDAGRQMTYRIHYENVGNADALDVQVIDVLDPDLDDATLVINDGGSYEPGSRSLRWSDPVVPPAEPRSVSFQVNVRADAEPGTRVRNAGTIIFPNAEPPTRIDTDFVEHVVVDPDFPPAPELSVLGCRDLGGGRWQVGLLNDGIGYAYNVSATIIDPPSPVQVNDGTARFAHKDDEDPSVLATTIGGATSWSFDDAGFTTTTPDDPCPTLIWRISWENLQGQQFEVETRKEPDRDNDAVADTTDNCPDTANPTQADADGDGTGDACEEPDRPLACDIDGDLDIDRLDVAAIFSARNTPANGADDPRDADGDGTITVLDGRQCAASCTRPGCSP